MHFIHFMEIDAAVRWIEDWFEGFLCSIYERMLLNWTVVLCLFWDCCNIVVTIWRFMSCKRLSVSHFSNMQAGRYLTTLCINVAGFMFVYTEINTDLQFFPSGQTSNCFQNTKVPKWPFFLSFCLRVLRVRALSTALRLLEADMQPSVMVFVQPCAW